MYKISENHSVFSKNDYAARDNFTDNKNDYLVYIEQSHEISLFLIFWYGNSKVYSKIVKIKKLSKYM